jgi:hypothetical protein
MSRQILQNFAERVRRLASLAFLLAGAAWLSGATPAGAQEVLVRVGGVDVPAGTSVHGDAVAIGGPLDIAGTVDGNALAVGGDATVTGRVGGSVRAIGGNVVLRSTAVVGGAATATGGRVTADPGATVGQAAPAPVPAPAPPFSVPVPLPPPGPFGGPHIWLWPPAIFGAIAALKAFFLLFLLGALLSFVGTTWLTAILFPRVTADLAALLERAPVATFGVGLLTWAAIWPLAIGLALSIVGLVLVALIPLAVIAALQLGVTAIAVLLGRRIRTSTVGLEALVGAVVLVVAFAIPHLGALVLFLSGTWGVGTIVLAIIERGRARPVAPPPPAVS